MHAAQVAGFFVLGDLGASSMTGFIWPLVAAIGLGVAYDLGRRVLELFSRRRDEEIKTALDALKKRVTDLELKLNTERSFQALKGTTR